MGKEQERCDIKTKVYTQATLTKWAFLFHRHVTGVCFECNFVLLSVSVSVSVSVAFSVFLLSWVEACDRLVPSYFFT